MDKIKILNNKYIGKNQPCFIIAEAGINHNGDIKIAKKMIDVAKQCGVDAIKFQTFNTDEFISDREQKYTYKSQGKEITESMYAMFKRHEFSRDEWKEIVEYCKSKDIIFFSTPQNPSDLRFLNEITDMPIIKVGADDLTNLELLKYYAKQHKPIIISAGMAYISEIEEAVEAIREYENNIIILHCISSYPAAAEEVNLNKIKTLKVAFENIVGFSDHTIGTVASVGAVLFGAKVIEKHFTLDKNMLGPDHWFSSNPQELKHLVDDIRYIEKAIGSTQVRPTKNETINRNLARRSIVASKDIKIGEKIEADSIVFKRPGVGLAPKYKKFIVGRVANTNINKDDIITLDKLY